MVHVNTSLRGLTTPVHTPAAARTAARGLTTPAASSAGSAAADFQALFASKTAPTPVIDTPPTPPAPTAESVFGPNPWISNPTGQGPGGSYAYNPYYFATAQTAATVAQMVGGTVVQSNQFTPNGGPFAQQQPNNMVQLPDGRLINPGLVASFYNHGYSQSYVDMMVACEVKNA
jgi:hypothetical protein